MKKICLLILAIIVLFSFHVTALASSETYSLDELGMTIDIPSEYIVFTRDIDGSDPALSAYGIDKEDMLDFMESNNIYLNAMDEQVSFEIVVTMTGSTTNDLNLWSDTELEALESFFESADNEKNVIEKYEIYQHEQTKFIKLHVAQQTETNTTYRLQYYTVYDNMAINVALYSYSGKINSDMESILNAIVDTVYFEKPPLLTESYSDTPAFLYKDEKTGTEFTVPANWIQEELSEDREYLDVKFISNKESGVSILYGSTDIWAEISSGEETGLSRSDINNSIFTSDEIAEMMGAANGTVSLVQYGGEEYYKYTATSSSSTYGINIKLIITWLIRIENGYLYFFQFSGDDSSTFYDDFESLLESVKYSRAANTSPLSDFSKFGIFDIVASLIITIAVYSVPIVIYRYGILRHPVEKKRAKKISIIYGIISFIGMSALISALNKNGSASGAILLWSWVNYRILIGGKESQSGSIPDNNFSNNGYCKWCGAKLINGSNFCSNCGEKIEKDSNQENNAAVKPRSWENNHMQSWEYEFAMKKQKRRSHTIVLTICTAAVFIIVLAVFFGRDSKYNDIIALIKNDKYEETISASEAPNDSKSNASQTYLDDEEKNQLQSENVGDTIFFGTYQGKSIEWQVLAKEDNKVLVISKYALACRPYNTRDKAVTWETCTLRKWLNNGFLVTAFSDEEKEKISTVTVPADKNPQYSVSAGVDTRDKVFLLSVTEAKEYFQSDEDRICEATEYAAANGAYISETDGAETCWWWLRTPGNNQSSAAYVGSNGSIHCFVNRVSNEYTCVRPAMWINLEA